MYPEHLHYSKDHEWVSISDNIATYGITHHAQNQLGDVVFVELPQVGSVVTQFQPCGVIESVKAVSDLFAPVSGKVVEVNEKLLDHLEKINTDPYGEGWMVKVEAKDLLLQLGELLRSPDYTKMIGEGA
ncbi:MAG: glycine cleavage system protein GcvH [Armatimonadetes bacterium]|nr:glycine cleavage system protein GcvH [Armatimonadota bacterium]